MQGIAALYIPAVSEADIGGMTVKVEPSHQHPGYI